MEPDQAVRPWPRSAEWVGRVTIALMCVGMCARAFRGGDAVFWLCWSSDALDWSEGAAELCSLGGAVALLVAGLCLLWPRSRLPLLFIAVWTSLLMIGEWRRETWWPQLVPAGTALRYLGPLALLLWLPATGISRWIPSRPRTAEGLLRLATALTFFAHGLEALWLKGSFLDYLFVASRDLARTPITQDSAEILLMSIGVLDLVTALLILRFRWPALAGWLAFWGLVTALARVVHSGFDNWSEAALRAPHAGLPLVLALTWLATRERAGAEQG